MKKLILTTALAFAASTAMADTPNRTTMSLTEFLEASGCVVVDKGGYSNIRLAADPTDPCPASVHFAFWGESSTRLDAGADGVLGTDDDKRVSDN